jgi:hypothetical protein
MEDPPPTLLKSSLRPVNLPPSCERPLLERFLRAEAMAMYSVKSAQADVPAHALGFLKRHEEEEQVHLREFEKLTGIAAREKVVLPRLPRQWHALAVHLYGYEALGLEFAKLLASIRPDLAHILADEETHVAFFEREIAKILSPGRGPANGAREYARAWIRRVPRTIEKYLQGEELAPHRDGLKALVLGAIERRFISAGLLPRASSGSHE